MTRLAVRRIAAWCVDWLIIIGYAAALVPLGLLLAAWSVRLSPAAWNAVSFLLLVAPVTGWLAFWEAAPRGASPGKRLLRLRVRTAAGSAPPLARALVRNALKVALPWELGHTAAFTLASAPAPGPAQVVAMGCGVAACLVVAGYAVSLVFGRTPYDRVAGTWVVRGPAAPR
jgi:uncharacterized RDD family membrane protein YckC